MTNTQTVSQSSYVAIMIFFISHFSLKKLSDLPTVEELGSAGLIDNTNIDSTIFGTGKFYKEKQEEKKENIYSNIDEMLSGTLKNEDKE